MKIVLQHLRLSQRMSSLRHYGLLILLRSNLLIIYFVIYYLQSLSLLNVS